MLSEYSAQYLVFFFFQCIHSLIRVCHCSLSYAAVQKGVSFLGVTNKWNQNSLASHIYKCFIQLHLCRTSPFPRYPCAVVPDWKTSAPWEVQTPSSWAALMGPGRHSGWVCIHAVNVFVWPFQWNLHCEHVAVFFGFPSVLKWTSHISKCWGHNIFAYVFE